MASQLKTLKKVRRLSREELQGMVDARNAFLPEDLKASHPERSFEPNYIDLKRDLPDQWVAVAPTRVDATGNVIGGRILATARDRDALDAEIAPLKEAHPQISIAVFFTGRYTFGGNLVIV